MKPKIKYRNEDLGELEIISDFLPSPEQLALRDDSVKVTISLSKSSIDFFKEQAGQHNTPYQKMIRRLLDSYVLKFKRPLTSQSSRRGDRLLPGSQKRVILDAPTRLVDEPSQPLHQGRRVRV